MKKNTLGLSIGLIYAGMLTMMTAQADLVRNPATIGANFDLGQVVRGYVSSEALPGGASVADQVLNRTSVYVTESGTYNDRFSVYLTVGGLFWYAMPAQGALARQIKFGPGVGQAQGQYSFGDVKAPVAKLQFGLFPEKYNPDAKDLGEYLFRSSAYPTVINTGGWSFIDAASYLAEGAKLTVPMFGGKVTNDFTIFTERDLEPTGDLDLGYLLTYKPTPYLEFGGGAVWAHAIELQSEESERTAEQNLTEWGYSKSLKLPLSMVPDSVTLPSGDTGYYSFKSVKLMARASLDLGVLLGVKGIAPGNFKLYGEWSWLGVEDYPYYYDKASERMPVMVGINIPTFKLLDMLSIEVEYHKSRFQDNNYPLVTGPTPSPPVVPATALDSEYHDVHWCVYARRHIYPGISIVAQAASDHLRPFDANVAPAYYPVTDLTRQWYYVLRLEIGI